MKLLGILILCEAALLAKGSDSCEASRGTLVSVNKCPENEAEWMEAAKRKNCLALAGSCSEPDRFVYHCILNPFVNETLEVCAYGREIFLGRCTEYSILGNLIQESGVDCTTFPRPCPVFYQSTEAFKYQECYKLVQKPTTVHPTTTALVMSTTNRKESTKTMATILSGYTTTTTLTMFTEGSHNKNAVLTAAVIVLIVFITTVIAIAIVIYRRQRRRGLEKNHKSDATYINSVPRSPPDALLVPSVMETDTEERHGLLAPSGELLKCDTKVLQVKKAKETPVEIHEVHSKDVKGVLERLDDIVENLIVAKTAQDPEDDSDLPINLQTLYETGAEFSDENIPLLQNYIKEVVDVHNYFEKRKYKPKKVKPD